VLGVWRRLWDLPGWMRVFMLGLVVNSAGALALIYLSLYLVQVRGLSPAAAGAVSAAYGLGMIGGTFAGGWFGDRYGVRRSLLVSRIGWVALCVAVPLAPTAALPVLVAMAGLSSGAGRPLQFAVVAAALPPQRRREGMALSRTATNLGFTIGPPLGALLAAHAFGLIFVVDGATTVVLTVIMWRFLPADRPIRVVGSTVDDSPAGRVGVWRTLRGDPRVIAILLTVIVVDTVYRQINTPLPLLLHHRGYPALAYGLLVAANGAIIVLAEAPLAVALRRRGALGVIATGYALVGLGLLVLGAAPGLVAASVAIVVITGGEMLYKPTATAHVADSAPAGAAARYQSLYAGASIAGLLFAPAVGGYAYEHVPGLLWPVAGALALGAAGVLWWVGRRLADRQRGAAPGLRPAPIRSLMTE
jgi:predicted MFS family arabinose efflux permease